MYEVKYDTKLRKWVVVDERTGKILGKHTDKLHAYRQCSALRDRDEEWSAELEAKMLRGIPGA